MKFTCNTKPLADALSLGIINNNVSNFYSKSTIVQLTIDDKSLRVNAVAASLVSEMIISGSVYGSDNINSMFVPSLALKQLVSSFEASTTTFEFIENAVVIYSGKSKFTLPDVSSDTNNSFIRPTRDEGAVIVDFNKDDWKFIKDHQMYAVGMGFSYPAYSRVWISKSGDVLTGDFQNSLFTHSKKNKLDETCLLTDTIINLFTAVPETSKLYHAGTKYILSASTDGFQFLVEISPEYEEVVGSYNSDIILGAFVKDPKSSISVDLGELRKFLSQAEILSSGNEDTIDMTLKDNILQITNESVDFSAPVQSETNLEFSMTFKYKDLKSIISKLDEDVATICPVISTDTDSHGDLVNLYVGATFYTKNMSAVTNTVSNEV